MGKGLVTDTNLTAIADAIRGKNGSSDTYTPAEMATAIENLPSGGGGGTSLPVNTAFAYSTISDFSPIIPMVQSAKYTYMGYMFYHCQKVTGLDLSSFDTSKVTNMDDMFALDSSLLTLDVSSFNTSKVTSMGSMFNSCSSLTALDVSSFDTSNVTYMLYLFRGLKSLTTLDVSNFNTAKVTNMYLMFYQCTNLANLDVSNFDISKATNIDNMFYGCSALTTASLGSILTMLNTATAVASTDRTLKHIGLTSAQATTCTGLSNWSALETAGWTTGY